MARLQTTVDSLYIVDGHRQPRALNVRAVEPVASSPQAIAKGSLYVLLELGGDKQAQPALSRLVLNTIQGVYYNAAGGITGGLTEAILAAHQALVQHNAVHPDEAQLGGVSCAVLRGEELYVGVGGPAMVLVGSSQRVDQFPSEISEDVTPLGSGDAPGIELFRSSIDSGALVIQLASEWVARVPAAKLATAAVAPDLPACLEYLEGLVPARAIFSAQAISVRRSQVEPVPDELEHDEEGALEAPVADVIVEEEAIALPLAGTALPVEDVLVPAGPAPTESEPPVSRPAERPAQAPAQPAKPAKRWPWLLVLLVPLAIVAAIAVGFWVQQRLREQQVQSLLQGAQAALQAANEQGVPPETARQQLADAQDRVLQALTLSPDIPQAISLQSDIQARLDEVNRITPLYKLVTLQPLGGEGSDPSRLVVEGSRVYILDQGLDRVVRYGLDEVSGLVPETSGGLVAERGQALPDGQLVGEIVGITWGGAGGDRRTSNLLVLDSNRNLLEADPATGIKPLAVAGRDQWVSPRAIAGYNGNFYLLDSGSGKILRYRPTADGYSSPPENYLEGDATLDFSGAIDMAIDGNIWVLYRDGTVQTFLDGRQQPFVLETPPDGPIVEPQAIIVGSEAGTAQSLFIVDSGKSRILEYDKSGKYLRQYRPADLTDREKLRKMRALQVDEINEAFFVLGTDGLYQTDIPQPAPEATVAPEPEATITPAPEPTGEQPTAEPASP